MTEKQIIENLVRALYIATERAISNGDRLLEVGKQDFNRGQFLALVKLTIKDAEKFIKIPEYNNFDRF